MGREWPCKGNNPMSSEYDVAVVGATGAVGHEFLRVLAEREYAMRSLKLLASPRSAGQRLPFRGEQHLVEALSASSFDDVDVAFLSAGGGTSREFAPKAVAAGAVVIDNVFYMVGGYEGTSSFTKVSTLFAYGAPA